MSEDNKDKDSKVAEDTRIKINPKDAATSMLPAGVDVEKLTPEQQLNVTSTMVKASRLHEKAIDGLTKEQEDVFNAILLATPADMDVQDRSAQAQKLFDSTVPKGETKDSQASTEETNTATKEETKISPKGEMDVASKVAVKDGNLMEEDNPSPLGDDDDYFKYLEDRYRKQTTMSRHNLKQPN